MDINNNDFFGEIKKDEFDDMNISNSGINYGDSVNKSSLKTIIIAIISGIVVAGVSIMLLSPNKKETQPKNFADIPTIPSPQEPIKIVPEDIKLNEVFENATIYTPTSFNTDTKTIETTKEVVKPEPLPQIPTTEIKKVETKKPLPPPSVPKKITTQKTEQKFIEKATNVKGEVEVSEVKTTTKTKSGVWNVQITSTSSESAANREWNNLVKKYPNILKGLTHTVSKTEVNGKIYYRLRISNLESSTKATEICNQLKANKLSCFITK